jgi:Domain of unknown function (DUF1918)
MGPSTAARALGPGPASRRAVRHASDEEELMRAQVGDHIVIETTTLDTARRRGEVIEVIGEADREHYRVRWQDGHESVYFPGADARVTTAPETSS